MVKRIYRASKLKYSYLNCMGRAVFRAILILVPISLCPSGNPILIFFFWCWHMEGRLDIYTIWGTVHDKVDFQLSSDKLLAVLILSSNFDQANIHTISTAAKFIIDDVLHNVCLLLLAIIEYGCTNANIGKSYFKYFLRSNIIFAV